MASRGRDLSQAAPIAERHGERLGGAHVLVHVHELAECPEAVAETDAKVQVPLEALRCLGQPLEDAQRLFEPLHRVAVGGARGRLDGVRRRSRRGSIGPQRRRSGIAPSPQ